MIVMVIRCCDPVVLNGFTQLEMTFVFLSDMGYGNIWGIFFSTKQIKNNVEVIVQKQNREVSAERS